ncbi:MAG TPA: hypothetical protein VJ044_13335, partial [Candidatus Hodarchaeales archaeon]|nr:hypothetical protein [Candidatus Hodarchaeales archaeon]
MSEVRSEFQKCFEYLFRHKQEIYARDEDHVLTGVKKFQKTPQKDWPAFSAVDGTCVWLWRHPELEIWLVIIRIAAANYRVDNNVIQGIDLKIEDTPVLLSTQKSFRGTIGKIHEELISLPTSRGREHHTIANCYRELKEYDMVLSLLKEHTGRIVAIDGDLSTYNSPSFVTKMDEIAEK